MLSWKSLLQTSLVSMRSSKPWQSRMRSKITPSWCWGSNSANVTKVLRGTWVSGGLRYILSEHILVFDAMEMFLKMTEDTERWRQDNKQSLHHRELPDTKNVCWSNNDIRLRWPQWFECSIYSFMVKCCSFWGKTRLTSQAQLSAYAAPDAQPTTLSFLFKKLNF